MCRNAGLTFPGRIRTENTLGFSGRMRIVLENEVGALGTISTIIAENAGNISNLKLINRRADFFELPGPISRLRTRSTSTPLSPPFMLRTV